MISRLKSNIINTNTYKMEWNGSFSNEMKKKIICLRYELCSLEELALLQRPLICVWYVPWVWNHHDRHHQSSSTTISTLSAIGEASGRLMCCLWCAFQTPTFRCLIFIFSICSSFFDSPHSMVMHVCSFFFTHFIYFKFRISYYLTHLSEHHFLSILYMLFTRRRCFLLLAENVRSAAHFPILFFIITYRRLAIAFFRLIFAQYVFI